MTRTSCATSYCKEGSSLSILTSALSSLRALPNSNVALGFNVGSEIFTPTSSSSSKRHPRYQVNEVVHLENMTHNEVVEFVTEHGNLLNLCLYYNQANGQVESSNQTLIRLIKKMIENSPRRWHKVLSEALWAHRISRHDATKVTPFELSLIK